MELALVLPWPSRDLSPNARVHYMARARAAKAARKLAYAIALSGGWHRTQLPAGRLHLLIDAYPPDRRRRDTDGILSALKPAIDGIADALRIDDHRFVPHPYLHDQPMVGGEIRVRITTEDPCARAST